MAKGRVPYAPAIRSATYRLTRGLGTVPGMKAAKVGKEKGLGKPFKGRKF